VWRALVIGALVAAGPGSSRAEELTASGSLGAGHFGPQPAATAEIGLDLAGTGWALGLGARGRWLADGGFRGEEWDELSEQARVIRYGNLEWAGGDAAVSAALGELGLASLGHGSIIDGYSSGLDVDHGHLGAQARARSGRVTGELLVDDLVAPRIAGSRVAVAARDDLLVAASLAGDRVAPLMDGGSDVVAAAGLDGELSAGGERTRGAIHADLVGIVGLGAGVHLGGSGSTLVTDQIRIGARAELRAGSRHYLPGWVGPLYERDRREMIAADGMERGQLEAARFGGLAGFGGAGRLTVEAEGVLTGEVGYAARRGVADVATLRLLAPFQSPVQAGVWMAAEGTEALALALEVRWRLPNRLFLRGDAARLYQDTSGSLGAIWVAQLALGAVLGE
jgi:hypothetical protein